MSTIIVVGLFMAVCVAMILGGLELPTMPRRSSIDQALGRRIGAAALGRMLSGAAAKSIKA